MTDDLPAPITLPTGTSSASPTHISRTDSQIAALRAEVARIDAAAEAGLDPYPIALREQQRRSRLTDIIRRPDAQQPGGADPEEPP